MAPHQPNDNAAAIVLAIDPGTVKCGIAVVRRADGAVGAATVLHREVVERERLVAKVLPLLAACGVEAILIGDATGSAVLRRAISESLPAPLPVLPVNEAFTSQRARQRYLRENPARGLRRLIPAGFRSPDNAYDDYVAVILAEDYFARSR